jgi:hypothetical protein
MADHYIANGDVFIPEVIGELINDAVYDQLALLNTPAVTDLNATFTNGGNTVTFPVFNGVAGDFEDLDATDTAATDPTITYADMTFETVDVISKIIDVGIKGCTLDDAYKAGNFQIVDACLEEVANKAAKMIDAYLISLAAATDLDHNVSGTGDGLLTRKAIIKAKTLKWGDMANMPSVLALHSAPYGDVVDEVKDYNIYGPGGVAVTEGMQIPRLLGSPIAVSDSITSTGSPAVYSNLIVAAGGIGFQMHRNISYAVIRQVGDRYVHEFVVRYFGKLRRKNGKNLAIKLRTKAAA